MATDAVQMRWCLRGEKEVLEMAASLGVPVAHVIGCLQMFWSWADEHLAKSQGEASIPCSQVDEIVQLPGFAVALQEVGWLDSKDVGLAVPGYSIYMGRSKPHRRTPPKPNEERVITGLVKDNVNAVIAHYKTYHPRARPGTKEKELIAARFRDGYSVDDLTQAIDGCHKSAFHCGDNDRGAKYQSLSLIVRDSAHVLNFIELSRPKKRRVQQSEGQRKFSAALGLVRKMRRAGKTDEEIGQELIKRGLSADGSW